MPAINIKLKYVEEPNGDIRCAVTCPFLWKDTTDTRQHCKLFQETFSGSMRIADQCADMVREDRYEREGIRNAFMSRVLEGNQNAEE